MNEELTYQDFIAYVKSRPEDEKIDHDGEKKRGGVWANCAVGDYVYHVLGDYATPYDASQFADFLERTNEPLHHELNNWRPATYGELSEMIDKEGW